MRRRVFWPTGGIAERKIRKQEARHANVFDDILCTAHDEGGYSIGLQNACSKANALVADRAVSDEQCRINDVSKATGNTTTKSVKSWSFDIELSSVTTCPRRDWGVA